MQMFYQSTIIRNSVNSEIQSELSKRSYIVRIATRTFSPRRGERNANSKWKESHPVYTEEPLTGRDAFRLSPLVTRSRPRLWFVDLDHRAGVNLRGVQRQALLLPTSEREPSTSLPWPRTASLAVDGFSQSGKLPDPRSLSLSLSLSLYSRLLRNRRSSSRVVSFSSHPPLASYQLLASLVWLIPTWTRD